MTYWFRAGSLLLFLLLQPIPMEATPPLPPTWPDTGLPVTYLPRSQTLGSIVPGTNGEFFISWTDERAGRDSSDIYLGLLSSRGWKLWRQYSSGFPVCTAPGRQLEPRMIPDGEGGVILVWRDERGPDPDIYVQRVTEGGQATAGWPSDGLPVCTIAGTQFNPTAAPDGSGGAFIAWQDVRDPSAGPRIYVQRVLGSGAIAVGWPSDGRPVSSRSLLQMAPSLLADGSGGVFACWAEYKTDTDADIRAIRLTASGDPSFGWPDSGLAMSAAPEIQDFPALVPDGMGGAFITWRDYRRGFSAGTASDVYAQHISQDGTFDQAWGGDGLLVGSGRDEVSIPSATQDGQGGLLVGWITNSLGSPNAFVQRLDRTGALAPGWNLGGVSLGTQSAVSRSPVILGDGFGGVFAAWADARGSTGSDVYGQHVTASGSRAVGWPTSGIGLCTVYGEQILGGFSPTMDASIISDGALGVIVPWTDYRYGYPDVYAQRLTVNGTIGAQPIRWVQNIFPNPSRGKLSLQATVPGPEGALVEIFNVRGCPVGSKRYTGLAPGVAALEVDLSDMPAGVYFLRYRDARSSRVLGSGKVVVVR